MQKIRSDVLIGLMVAVVIGVSLVSVIGDSINHADVLTETENFVAEEDDSTEETFTLENEALDDEVKYVEVEGDELDSDDYSVDGDEVTIDDSSSDTDDEVEIKYDYEGEMDESTKGMLDIVPTIFIAIIVAAIGYAIKPSKK